MKRITLFVLMLSIVCIPAFGADTGDGPDLGGKDKILKKSPADLGYTNVPNWLQFPPADHQDWKWDDTVAGVAVDSKDNVYVSHRGDGAPRLTVWKPDGSFLRVFPGQKPAWPHYVNVDKDGNQEANWTHIGRVYKICEGKDGNYLVSDGLTGRITKVRRD